VNILKALILTLAPALLGLSSTYLEIYQYDLSTLLRIIGLQLYYVEFRWLAISLVLNMWLLWKLDKQAKNGAKPQAELKES
jgi:hypothetical protein